MRNEITWASMEEQGAIRTRFFEEIANIKIGELLGLTKDGLIFEYEGQIVALKPIIKSEFYPVEERLEEKELRVYSNFKKAENEKAFFDRLSKKR